MCMCVCVCVLYSLRSLMQKWFVWFVNYSNNKVCNYGGSGECSSLFSLSLSLSRPPTHTHPKFAQLLPLTRPQLSNHHHYYQGASPHTPIHPHLHPLTHPRPTQTGYITTLTPTFPVTSVPPHAQLRTVPLDLGGVKRGGAGREGKGEVGKGG